MPTEDSQTYAVRLPASAISITESLIKLHHKLQHIPEATPSAYLKYLVIQNGEKMRDEINKRCSRVTQ